MTLEKADSGVEEGCALNQEEGVAGGLAQGSKVLCWNLGGDQAVLGGGVPDSGSSSMCGGEVLSRGGVGGVPCWGRPSARAPPTPARSEDSEASLGSSHPGVVCWR